MQIQDLYLLLFLQALEQLSETSEAFKEKLRDIEELSIQFKVRGIINCFFVIKKGNLTAQEGTHTTPSITLEMARHIAKNLFNTSLNAQSALEAGALAFTIEPGADVGIFRILLEIAAKELGIEQFL